MKVVLLGILAALLLFLLTQLWYFYGRGAAAEEALADLERELTLARRKHEDLEREFEYSRRPENMEKELRGRFNYRAPGETMMVIVPATGTQP